MNPEQKFSDKDIYRYDRYSRYIIDHIKNDLLMNLEYKSISDCKDPYPNIKITNESDVKKLEKWQHSRYIKNLEFDCELKYENSITIPDNIVSIICDSYGIKFQISENNKLKYYQGADNHNLLLSCKLKYYNCDKYKLESVETYKTSDNFNNLQVLECDEIKTKVIPKKLKVLNTHIRKINKLKLNKSMICLSMDQEYEITGDLNNVVELSTNNRLTHVYPNLKTLYVTEFEKDNIACTFVIPNGVEVTYLDNIGLISEDAVQKIVVPESCRCLVVDSMDENELVIEGKGTLDYLVIREHQNFKIDIKCKTVYFISCDVISTDQFLDPKSIQTVYLQNTELQGIEMIENIKIHEKPEKNSIYDIIDEDLDEDLDEDDL